MGTAKAIRHFQIAYFKFLGAVGKAFFNGGLGTLIRQKWTDGKAMMANLSKMIQQIPNMIGQKLANEWQEFSCYNQAARTEKVCSIIGYLGTDVLLIPFLGELAVSKLSAIPRVAKWMEMASETLSAARRVAMGLAYKVLSAPIRIAEAVAKKLPWVFDKTSKAWVAIFGENVVEKTVENGEVVYRSIVKPSVKQRLINAMERALGPPKSLATNPIKRSLQWTGNQIKKPLRWTWNKLSFSQEKIDQAIRENWERAAKDIPPLPANYPADADFPNLPKMRLEDIHPDNPVRAQLVAASKQEAEASSKLWKLKRVDNGTTAAGDGETFVLKDKYNPNADQVFHHVQDEEGNWVYRTDQKMRLKLDANQTTYAVYLPYAPERLGEALPDVLRKAKKMGSEFVDLGANQAALSDGRSRLVVYFTDTKKAKLYAEEMDKASHTQGWFSATQKPRVGVMKRGKQVMTRSLAAAETRCGAGQDPRCYCEVFLEQGINPDDGQPINFSPFNCATPEKQKAAFEEALKEIQAQQPASADSNAPSSKYKPPLINTNPDASSPDNPDTQGEMLLPNKGP